MPIINNENYSLEKKDEAKKFFQLLLLSKFLEFPFFSNLLLNSTDITDVHKENKENSLAYTYFDFETERIKICINYNRIEKEKFNNETINFIIYHELLHNFFHHLIRFRNEMKENNEITNVVLDFYCNEFLFRFFNNKRNYSVLIDKYQIINFEFLQNYCLKLTKLNLPFNRYEDKPLEDVVLKFLLENLDPDIKKEMKNKNFLSENSFVLDDHNLGYEYSKKSLENVNNKKKNEKKQIVTFEEAEIIQKHKMESFVHETTEQLNSVIGAEGEEFLRIRKNIFKKIPFLNFVKLKRTINKLIQESEDKNYSKPNRKKQHMNNIVYKGRVRIDGKKLVVAIDVSGSVSDKELEIIYNMLKSFLEKKEILIDVIFWSNCSIKNNIHAFKNIISFNDLLKLKITSSGGTSLKTLHDYIQDNYKKEKINLLLVSDGYFENKVIIPKIISEYFICLTEDTYKSVKNTIPKATIKYIKINI